MTPETFNLPAARSWRDIPQPAVPRAMSPEGRWRLTKAIARGATVAAICGAFVWMIWLVVASMEEGARRGTAVVRETPMKAPELATDGVLDSAWLGQVLALPKNATLMQLNLENLRSRLLADDQVVNATLTRKFPDRLIVQITERSPVARVMTETAGRQQMLLVARDGVTFAGTGYDKALLDSLPWLDGVSLKREGGRLLPIGGMADVADLLAKARLEAEHLYATWRVVSLARLATDHRVEIQASNGETVIFNTRDDYFRQLAKLNYITDQLVRVPGATANIDLSLGRDVPVTVATTPAEPTAPEQRGSGRRAPSDDSIMPQLGATTAHSEEAFFVLPNPQPRKIKREL